MLQKDMTHKQKEFLISLNELKNTYTDSTNLILKNSLYVYSNQDNVAQTNKKLSNNYEHFLNSKILQDKNYLEIVESVKNLKNDVEKHIQEIELFLRINANIKNSLLFLGRHVEDGNILQKYDQNELLKAREILNYFNDAKNFQDLGYLNGKNFTLHSNLKSHKVQYYINSFNLHSNFLLHEYPTFLKITKDILNNEKFIDKLNDIEINFKRISLNDSDALDRFAYLLFTFFIISLLTIITLLIKYKKDNKKLQEISQSLEFSLTYDYLTGLKNRKKFEDDIKKTLKPCLMLININEFKHINEIYGNTFGNKVLIKLSKFIKNETQDLLKCQVYRIGGDEFGILFENISDDKILDIAHTIEENISQHNFKVQNIDIYLKTKVAINSIEPILENASSALKHIKAMNDLDIYKYDASNCTKQNIKENMEIIHIIKEALSDDRIIPFFQPIINLQTSKIEKYEALVRLQLKDGKFLPPFKFLELSKQSSLYHKITKTMIEKVIQTAKEYPQYRFSINMSMIDIQNEKIMQALFSLFEKNKHIASRIDIELLESEHLEDINLVKNFIQRLKIFNSKVLVDDFGTGYSNFSYFGELEVDIIKIDGSIVKEITTNQRKLHMFKSIKEFANGMGMKTVSEFVENQDIAKMLKESGAVYAQGYYFSPPLQKPLDNDNVII
jgi:diguanylate cyclase (GGDEF)-like protein